MNILYRLFLFLFSITQKNHLKFLFQDHFKVIAVHFIRNEMETSVSSAVFVQKCTICEEQMDFTDELATLAQGQAALIIKQLITVSPCMTAVLSCTTVSTID